MDSVPLRPLKALNTSSSPSCLSHKQPTRSPVMVRQRAGAAWHGLGCWCGQEDVPAGAASWGHMVRDESQRLWEMDITEHESPRMGHLITIPLASSLASTLHLLPTRPLQASKTACPLVWIPNIDLLGRRDIGQFSCSAHATNFTATRKKSRSHSPRCG